MKKYILILLLCVCYTLPNHADSLTSNSSTEAPPCSAPYSDNITQTCVDRVQPSTGLSLELTSGALFGLNNDSHTLVPISLALAIQIDEIGLTGWRQGYTEFLLRALHQVGIDNEESRITGFQFGPRYRFIQDGLPIVPYIGSEVGFGFADSDPKANSESLGQDFNFTFSVNAGATYYITEAWFIQGEIMYIHYSNAGLSEPAFENFPIDAIGPQLTVGHRF